MKIEFYDPFEDDNLKYQKEAIEAITDIFKGQEITQTLFGIKTKDILGTEQIDTGIGNRLTLNSNELLKNIQTIQKKNALEITKNIDKNNLNFSIEMETGTGKTYVFLRTIFELNKKYGFKKFIIVVPSIAIKEGIKKNLDITKKHFLSLYENTPYNYFIYNSNKLNQINEFSRSSDIEIMIINIDAFNKSKNIINLQQEATLGKKPIDIISSMRPIVIIDEPQSVDTTDKAKTAINSLNPLFVLRYSATHKEKYNLMYKLDAVSAYEKKLVKQIEVASVRLSNNSNSAYIKFLSVDNKQGIKAKVEIDILKNGEIKRTKKTIKGNSDLFEITGRDIYSNFIVTDIYKIDEDWYIEFNSGENILKVGETIGEIDIEKLQYMQIKKTIEEHLDKEKILLEKGIKVLSLFFIDKVANYREYNDKTSKKGKFALIFEKTFNELIKTPKYQKLYEKVYKNLNTSTIHDGYFSADKKGKFKDTTGKTQADESTYEKIMKNKEKLLSLDEPLRFIFSHSALKEGWDNPNVFQICTLINTKSDMTRRQKIGRGLRLCVNNQGKRVYGFDINRLTIIANESYKEFAETLQKEYEKDLGIKFGIVEKTIFYPIVNNKSEELFEFLVKNEYIDKKGNIKEKLKKDIDNLPIPEEFKNKKEEIIKTIKSAVGRKIEIKNANDKETIKLQKQVLLSDDFIELWDKIKAKTIYKIDFDVDELINRVLKRIDEEIKIGYLKFEYEKAKIDISKSQIQTTDEKTKVEHLVHIDFDLPDIISFLTQNTNLKRNDIVKILTKISNLNYFKRNPQKFIEEVLKIIKSELNKLIVDGIKYEKIEDYLIQEIFDKEEIVAYLNNLVKSDKSIYDYTICDSNIEKKFVKEFNKNENIKLFAKLPANFKINTPIGHYNPDFAIVVDTDEGEKLYFVLESKGSDLEEDRRGKENQKIKCAKKHFELQKVDYVVSDSFERFKEEW